MRALSRRLAEHVPPYALCQQLRPQVEATTGEATSASQLLCESTTAREAAPWAILTEGDRTPATGWPPRNPSTTQVRTQLCRQLEREREREREHGRGREEDAPRQSCAHRCPGGGSTRKASEQRPATSRAREA
ncbi:unnamed protein product [Prorocentrum cordatum]|uniref:Uncharacterized protein n=1 Tax=Prorocentrum cordatum TaxID=2364126 RepID=A0ABN9Y810_9DINO|nr:unnamed protein product [Polarella glacialis]